MVWHNWAVSLQCKLKAEVNMWFAVIVFVCLATEVLSYLSGGEIEIGRKADGSN